ncbi:MAG: UvrD-helicase domain-containing protein, partial [Pseudomonadota bacterium]
MVNALNDQQREAVRYVDGPLLVLAGAGSGKTSVITQKIVRLIDKHEVPAENVVAVTFTNKAAREMRERVKKLRARTRSPEPWISTFHTLGLRILAEEFAELGYRQGYSIFDANDTLNLIVDLMRRERGADLKPQMIQGVISRWKNNLWEPSHGAPLELRRAKWRADSESGTLK